MKVEDYHKLSLNFVNALEGYKTLFKNLHWSSTHLTSHRLVDDVLTDVSEFQDTIAECSQGYMKRQFVPGEIKGKAINFNKPDMALDALEKEVSSFCDAVCNEKGLNGITNAINDFEEKILKYKYLFLLSNKDGSTSIPVIVNK